MLQPPKPIIEEADKPSASFSSWKFDLVNAAGFDRDLQAPCFRVFVRILAAARGETWDQDAGTVQAYLADETIADEVPGCRDRNSRRDYKKALAQLGWLEFEPGQGRTATRYLISDRRLNSLFDQIDELREGRKEKRNAAEERYREGGKHHPSDKPTKKREGGKRPQNAGVRGGVTSPERVGVYPPVHLILHPQPLSLPVKDETQDTREAEPSALPDRSSWDAEDWQALFDERAGFLEFDAGYSRSEAEEMAAAEISAERSSYESE